MDYGKLLTIGWSLLISATLSACLNPRVYAPSEFIGVWRAEYTDHFSSGIQSSYSVATGSETLTIKDDGSYQQVYENGKGYVYVSPWNRWRLQKAGKRLKEDVFLLENGRNYQLGIKEAERRAEIRDRSRTCTYNSFIYGDNAVTISCADAVLYVINDGMAKRGIRLQYVAPSDPDNLERVMFFLVDP